MANRRYLEDVDGTEGRRFVLKRKASARRSSPGEDVGQALVFVKQDTLLLQVSQAG